MSEPVPPPLDATVWAEAFDLQTFTFTDQELQEILGVIEQKTRAGEGDLHEGLDFFAGVDNAAASGPGPLPLQFQPHDAAVLAAAPAVSAGALDPSSGALLLKAEDTSASSFAVAGTGTAEQQAGLLPQAVQQLMAGQAPLLGGGVAGVHLGHGPSPTTAMMPPPANGLGQGHLAGVMAAAYAAQGATSAMHLAGATSGTTAVPRYSSNGTTKASAAADQPKGQISHSTVEKQRRDRINSLIDELRELVPPQRQPGQRSGPQPSNETLEARRPKHVVLADTIALLKAMQTATGKNGITASGQLSGQRGEEQGPANSEGNSKGSSSQDEMDVGGAPQIPFIPCQITQNSGVTVERGPDCLYVQVKCRDRKGLLSDIINSLRLLPLEIRTAAVTTTTDGTVRDVFEVKMEDPTLPPEDVQNMVHDALFQQHITTADNLAGKRQRQQFS